MFEQLNFPISLVNFGIYHARAEKYQATLYRERKRANNGSTVVFAGINLLIAVALTVYGGAKLQGSIGVGIAAGVIGAVGLTAFNLMLSKSKPTEVGSLFVLMVMAQIAVPAVYQMVMSGDVSLKKVAGFLAAFAATVLLG